MTKKIFVAFVCAVIGLSLTACGNGLTGQEKQRFFTERKPYNRNNKYGTV